MTHKHIIAPDAVCLEPFGKRYGYRKEEWQRDNKLAKYLMDEYAKDRGFVPTDSWYLVVHPNGQSDFHPIDPSTADSPERLVCCTDKDKILEMLDDEAVERGDPVIARRNSE